MEKMQLMERDVKKIDLAVVEVLSDTGFMEIVKKQVEWKQAAKNKGTISTQEQLDQAVDIFNDMKLTVKRLEEIRQWYVAFPTQYVKMVNETFKGVRDSLEDSRKVLGELIQDKKRRDEEEYQRKKEEAEKGQGETGSEEVEDGVERVKFATDLPEAPSNTVESKRGAKVHTRSGIEVEVIDVAAFLKLLVSRDRRNEWLTQEVENLVSFNIGHLKKVLKANPTKRKVKGLKIKKVEKVV